MGQTVRVKSNNKWISVHHIGGRAGSRAFPIKTISTGYTDVEKVLIKYGLKSQANILRKNRIIQMQCLGNH